MPDDLIAKQEQEVQAAEVFSFDVENFRKQMREPDFVSVIIRAQLHLEHVLIQTLTEAFIVSDAVDLRRVNFPTKLDMCVALALVPNEWRPAALFVNELRNKIAHRLDFLPADGVKGALWESLPAFLRTMLLEHHGLDADAWSTLTMGNILEVLILWLDVARQKAKVSRIENKYGHLYLERVLRKNKGMEIKVGTN